MNDLLHDVATRATRYLGESDAPVWPAATAVEALRQFRTELPEEGLDAARVIAQLDALAAPATTRITGGRYFGFVNGGTLPAALAANWLTSAWDQNAAMYVMSPAASVLEDTALQWIVSALGFRPGTNGAFTTGATVASFTALAAARTAVLEQAGWNVERDGLFGAPPITVITGEEAHVTLYKALGLLGLGRDRVVKVPVDSQGRLRPDALPAISGPTIVCLQAGNVNTGAFDPAGEVADRAQGRAWIHVDGAFGLWACAHPGLQHLTRGYERCDSWAMDAHKWLNVTYDCGVALVRHPAALRQAMSITAPYLAPSPYREGLDWGPESSRRARGIEVWAVLRSLGRRGLIELVDRCNRHAQQFARQLKAGGATILNDAVINQVLVRFGDDDHTRGVIQRIQEDRTCWCGGTVWQGRTAMRISVSCWATTEEDVDRSVAAMLRCARGTP